MLKQKREMSNLTSRQGLNEKLVDTDQGIQVSHIT